MEYIAKNRHEEAHALIDGFLQRHRERHGGVYELDLYKYISADFLPDGRIKTRQMLVQILLDEQHGRCCYCMRQIDGLPPEERSIEHVIVNHPRDANDYDQYLGHGSLLDTSDMIQTAEFVGDQTPPPPYPHSVAYENMLMSCAGHCHLGSNTSHSCNNKRVHEFVMPLPLMPDVNNEVKYGKNGFVHWTKEKNTSRPTVEVLGLNNNVLRIIRRIWCKVSSKKMDIADCDRQVLIYEVLGDMLDDGEDDATLQLLFLFANNNWYWNLLSEYKYFDDSSKFV